MIVLRVTDAAGEAISALGAQDGQQETSGLRFAVPEQSEEKTRLSMSLAEGPEAGDQVVTAKNGARVFLEPQATQFLDDKVLDVEQDAQGQLSFAIMPGDS